MQKTTDRYFLVALSILLVFGLVALSSASAPEGYSKFNDVYFFVKHQLIFGILPGIFLFLVLTNIRIDYVLALSPYMYVGSLLLLVLVFIPHVGAVINGSHSWIRVAGFSLQPSEVAKFAVIMYLAALLSNRSLDWDDWRQSLLPILGVLAPVALLILLQPDLGTGSILAAIVFAMFFIAGVPARYLAMLASAGVVALCILIVVAPYRTGRLTTFLHPELDPKGIGYQINQAFLAVGSGGLLGVGYGHSRQKFEYLPEVNADSIFAVIAEEMGFFVSLLIVALIAFIGWRTMRIVRRSGSAPAILIGTGVATWFLTQSFLNIGAMVGALPLTGVPLPLVSHGGSAMLASLAAFGTIASISKHS